MPFVLTPFFRKLQFRFAARTSRGALQDHNAHFLKLHHTANPPLAGWGECSPLPGLSPDYSPHFAVVVQKICHQFNALKMEQPDEEAGQKFWDYLQNWPSICFAAETAWLDYLRGGKQLLYHTPFACSEKGIWVNGLIWMGDVAFMREQIEKKMAQGYSCLKLKIGSLDFQQELKILQEVRAIAGPGQLEIRLDANGAFTPQDALWKIESLAQFSIHSLEQPIKAGQQEAMQAICAASPIPIALDEELIGVTGKERKWALLRNLQPAYIIIKPTLVGGLYASREWVQVAESLGVGWWLTSALESNIGLNAIAQFASDAANPLPQGLGTGQLYHNNFASPLEMRGEMLWYNPAKAWEFPG